MDYTTVTVPSDAAMTLETVAVASLGGYPNM